VTEILSRLVTMEQAIHRAGWDQPPTLHLMRRQGGVRMTRVPGPDAGQALAFLAQQMEQHADQPDLQPILAEEVQRGAAAVVFACETWMSTGFANDEERAADPRDLADIPGSREARMVCAMDLDSCQYVVMRIRGEKPETEVYPLGHPERVEGLVFESLARIAAVIAAAMAEGSVR